MQCKDCDRELYEPEDINDGRHFLCGKKTLDTVLEVTNMSATKIWKIEDAIGLYRQIEKEFRAGGFLLTMYGSVIRFGWGKDLDLIAVPWRVASTEAMIMHLVGRTDLFRYQHIEFGHYQINLQLLHRPSGYLPVDIMIRNHGPINNDSDFQERNIRAILKELKVEL